MSHVRIDSEHVRMSRLRIIVPKSHVSTVSGVSGQPKRGSPPTEPWERKTQRRIIEEE
jgi:hypothetical protein